MASCHGTNEKRNEWKVQLANTSPDIWQMPRHLGGSMQIPSTSIQHVLEGQAALHFNQVGMMEGLKYTWINVNCTEKKEKKRNSFGKKGFNMTWRGSRPSWTGFRAPAHCGGVTINCRAPRTAATRLPAIISAPDFGFWSDQCQNHALSIFLKSAIFSFVTGLENRRQERSWWNSRGEPTQREMGPL